MNLMLDDDVLTRLLGEAAEEFTVPEVTLEPEKPARSYRRVAKWGAVAAALVAGVVVVQSLGGTSSPSRNTTTALTPSTTPQKGLRDALSDNSLESATGAEGPISGTNGSGVSGLSNGPEQSSDATSQGSKTFAPTTPTAAAPDGFTDGAKIVKTGSISLIVKDNKVSQVVGDVTTKMGTFGGYVADSKTQEYGDNPSSTITIRVPVAHFDDAVKLVRAEIANGVGKVDASSTSGQDVTAQYADVSAQIQSLSAARSRFLLILSRANTIGETLSVQQRVDSVQQQIDQLNGRLRVLKDQTSMGTLTVTVGEKAKAVATHEQSGLSKAWDNATHGFTSGVESLISKSGRGLLVLLVALVCVVILRTGWRLARRRLV